MCVSLNTCSDEEVDNGGHIKNNQKDKKTIDKQVIEINDDSDHDFEVIDSLRGKHTIETNKNAVSQTNNKAAIKTGEDSSTKSLHDANRENKENEVHQAGNGILDNRRYSYHSTSLIELTTSQTQPSCSKTS